jgi:rare lipoprotein A
VKVHGSDCRDGYIHWDAVDSANWTAPNFAAPKPTTSNFNAPNFATSNFAAPKFAAWLDPYTRGVRAGRRLPGLAAISLAAIFLIGCAGRQPAANRQPAPPVQPGPEPPAETAKSDASPVIPTPRTGVPFEEGKASWYGAPFHGRQASDGEIYDMNKLTAAHRTLPFNTMVRVTNLNNGKSTTVRITDRGPFVDNRIIDLSYAAAREIESVGPGVVPVRLEILSAIDPTVGFFTVQIGAFRDRANAERLRDRLSSSYSPVAIQSFESPGGSYYRVHVGKVSGEDAAKKLGEQLHQREGVKPLIFRVDTSAPGGGDL